MTCLVGIACYYYAELMLYVVIACGAKVINADTAKIECQYSRKTPYWTGIACAFEAAIKTTFEVARPRTDTHSKNLQGRGRQTICRSSLLI
jgi:hypothetical protein